MTNYRGAVNSFSGQHPLTRLVICLLVALIVFVAVTAVLVNHLVFWRDSGDVPIVVVYYYVWYDEEQSRHWNDSSVTRVIDVPIWGFYSSMNETVIRRQLELIRDAGIDGLLIS